jgi:hypothetical protein
MNKAVSIVITLMIILSIGMVILSASSSNSNNSLNTIYYHNSQEIYGKYNHTYYYIQFLKNNTVNEYSNTPFNIYSGNQPMDRLYFVLNNYTFSGNLQLLKKYINTSTESLYTTFNWSGKYWSSNNATEDVYLNQQMPMYMSFIGISSIEIYGTFSAVYENGTFSLYNTQLYNNKTFGYSSYPINVLFSPIQEQFTFLNKGNTSFSNNVIYYNIGSSYNQIGNLYPVTFQSNTSFSLYIDNLTFSNVKNITVYLGNGTYGFNYTVGSNSYRYTGIISIYGKGLIYNISGFHFQPIYNFYIFIVIILSTLLLIGRYTKGFMISYVVSGILFIFVGYSLGIEYFTKDLIVYVIVTLGAIFTYKVVMK